MTLPTLLLPDSSPAPFNAKAWVNASLRSDNSQTPLDMRISMLITRLQMATSDADAEIQRAMEELIQLAPKLAREVSALREQASTVRSEISSLAGEAEELSTRSEASVSLMRETLHTQQRVSAVRATLEQAEGVSQQLRGAELAFERGELSEAASYLSKLSSSLHALGEEGKELFPTAQPRVDDLRHALLEQLQPALVRAVSERDVGAMGSLVRVSSSLQMDDKPRAVYTACQQGPIFEKWSTARREDDAAGGLRAFCDFLVDHTRAEQAGSPIPPKPIGRGSQSLLDVTPNTFPLTRCHKESNPRQMFSQMIPYELQTQSIFQIRRRFLIHGARLTASIEQVVLTLLPPSDATDDQAEPASDNEVADAFSPLESALAHAASCASSISELIGPAATEPTSIHDLVLAPFDAAILKLPGAIARSLHPKVSAA
ncbi:MAG: hypothetical protein SGPRY_001189 [Prymnesium sp.]